MKESNKGFMASDVQVELLSNKICHDEYKCKKLTVIWKCGNKTQSQTLSLSKYIKNQNKALGFHSLFTIKNAVENKWKFKVVLIVTNIQSSSSTNAIVKKNKHKLRNLKNQTIFECLGIKNNKIGQTKTSKYINIARPYKHYLTIKDETRISGYQLKLAITKVCNKLKKETLFDIGIPTIDCFASDTNYQTMCSQYITKKDDYFSLKYDDISFWHGQIAWCFPPYHRKTIVDTINSFKKRRMKGYVFVPWEKNQTWIGQTQRIAVEFCFIKGTPHRNDIFVADKTILKQQCWFDAIIFYFNYQQ